MGNRRMSHGLTVQEVIAWHKVNFEYFSYHLDIWATDSGFAVERYSQTGTWPSESHWTPFDSWDALVAYVDGLEGWNIMVHGLIPWDLYVKNKEKADKVFDFVREMKDNDLSVKLVLDGQEFKIGWWCPRAAFCVGN